MITLKLENVNFGEPTALALGSFDGLHLGHAVVINHAVKSDMKSAVVSFHPKTPREVLLGTAPKQILSYSSRREKLREMGVNYNIEIDFMKIKDLSPAEFIDKLCAYLNIKMLCCGYDFRFGKDGEGTAQQLKNICEQRGITCFIAKEVKVQGETCSSTKIREALANDECEKAEKMLGYRLQ